MKRISRLLVMALVIAAALTVFAIPASAEILPNHTWVVRDNPDIDTRRNDYWFIIKINFHEKKYTTVHYALSGGEAVNHGEVELDYVGMHLVTISNDEVPQALKDALKQDYPNLSSATGSILSEGNWWIIVVAAVAVIGGATAIIIVKKKTALTGGEDDTNER